MKKMSLFSSVVAGLIVGMSAVHAEGITIGEKIIGIEGASATIKADTYPPFGELDHEGSDIEYGIRLGAQNKEWRTLLIANYFDSSDDDQEYFKAQATFDYLLVQDSAFKPFIGLNLGYISYTTSNPNGDDDDSGFLYGAQAGFLVRVADHVQFDVSYRYSFASSDTVNHTESIVVGLNYIF